MTDTTNNLNHRINAVVAREGRWLKQSIRRQVPTREDAEDVFQEVLLELTLAEQQAQSIEQVGAWLMRVAKNRIIDRFRKKRELALADLNIDGESEARGFDNESYWLDTLCAPLENNPDALFEREELMTAIELALDELPAEQRAVFVAHEFDGVSFNAMSAQSGVGVNTLLARKRYAVLHLRERLADYYAD